MILIIMRRAGIVKPENDAFGQELWAYYYGQDMCEIVERDDGYFSAHQRPAIYFSEYKDWSIIEQKAMGFVKGKVLDVGCGAGRHSLYLQREGFDVVSIDSSPLAVKVCKLRWVKKAGLMSLEGMSFRPGAFDTILMLGGNFALLGNPRKAGRLLRKFFRMTSNGAVIIGEMRDPYRTDNPIHLDYHKWNRSRGKLSGQSKIKVRFEKTATGWVEWMLVSKEEVERLLRGTGWAVSEFVDSGDSGYVTIIKKVK
jgi:SAM-dependent methyltransferase